MHHIAGHLLVPVHPGPVCSDLCFAGSHRASNGWTTTVDQVIDRFTKRSHFLSSTSSSNWNGNIYLQVKPWFLPLGFLGFSYTFSWIFWFQDFRIIQVCSENILKHRSLLYKLDTWNSPLLSLATTE